jgi:glycosyltransferase involved in cell wall biosynthesis
MNKITFCIPSKNNLRYLKNSISSIIKNSTQKHDIIVFIDADNDGTEDWLKENNIKYLKNNELTPKGIAFGYNRCIEAAQTDVVCMFHADMYLAKDFDTNTLKHLKPKTVISATRIEPPLHPPGLEKIVQDFGMYPEDFKENDFVNFVDQQKNTNANKTTNGIFAPWVCYKQELLDLNLHDEEFHSYHEDSDIFNRMLLNDMECIQSRDAFVYHLTCRGGQFQDGIEKITTDKAFHTMKDKAAKHYIRKWGSWIKNNEYQHPILSPKYDIGFVVSNCNAPLLEFLEPWCSTLYIKNEMGSIVSNYIRAEQPNTSFNLQERIQIYGNRKPNDILISFDGSKLTQPSFGLLQQMPNIIKDNGEPGTFELDIFTITIIRINELQNTLIKI